jgi:hypothetical protein
MDLPRFVPVVQPVSEPGDLPRLADGRKSFGHHRVELPVQDYQLSVYAGDAKCDH